MNMKHPITGSRERREEIGPLERAKFNSLYFIQGMATLNTMDSLVKRLTVIEAMLQLQIVKSGSTYQGLDARLSYLQELKEIEDAISLLCQFTDVPEA